MMEKENTPKTYLGKEYTTYEALQRQRYLERTMRKYRQDIKLMEDGGASEESIMLKKARYHGKMQEYKAFSKSMKLPEKKERIYQDGLKGKFDITEKQYQKIQERVAKPAGSDIIKMYRKGSTHRRISESGTAIIDKATYHKITNPVIKQGADIRIANEEWTKHLEKENASAVTIGDIIFFREDATVSDVLEECYHFTQNRNRLNCEYRDRERIILNEIDAKEYVLSMSEKYKVPQEEIELTKRQLESYKKEMNELIERGEWNA